MKQRLFITNFWHPICPILSAKILILVRNINKEENQEPKRTKKEKHTLLPLHFSLKLIRELELLLLLLLLVLCHVFCLRMHMITCLVIAWRSPYSCILKLRRSLLLLLLLLLQVILIVIFASKGDKRNDVARRIWSSSSAAPPDCNFLNFDKLFIYLFFQLSWR